LAPRRRSPMQNCLSGRRRCFASDRCGWIWWSGSLVLGVADAGRFAGFRTPRTATHQPCRSHQPEHGRPDCNKWRNTTPRRPQASPLRGLRTPKETGCRLWALSQAARRVHFRRLHPGGPPRVSRVIGDGQQRDLGSELGCEPTPGCGFSALRTRGRRRCRSVSHRGYWR
jgi:hypothetical protein